MTRKGGRERRLTYRDWSEKPGLRPGDFLPAAVVVDLLVLLGRLLMLPVRLVRYLRRHTAR